MSRVALVTGGSRGIGAAISTALKDAGYSVAATYAGNDEAAAKLAGELIQYCRSQLADVKCPRSIDFREELPRHPTGKLYKRLLKDEYWQAADRSI